MESRYGGESSWGYSRGESREISYGESRGYPYEQSVKSNVSSSRIEELKAKLSQLKEEIELEKEKQRLESEEEERLLRQIRESQTELNNLRKGR